MMIRHHARIEESLAEGKMSSFLDQTRKVWWVSPTKSSPDT